MTIVQTEEGVLIKTTAPINVKMLQRMADYYTALEISARAQGTQEQADELSRASSKEWWEKNRDRFIK